LPFVVGEVLNMRSVLNWLQTGSLAAAVWVGAMASDAMAAVIVNITQSGSNVVATLSGSLSSLGTPTGSSSNQGAGGSVLVVPGDPSNGIPELNIFDVSTGSGSRRYSLTYSGGLWGASFSNTAASGVNLTGVKLFAINKGFSKGLYLAEDYVFGTAISGTVTWNNKTLADLGITNLGTYVYTAGSGENTDTVTFNLSSGGGGGEVPEPTSMAIFGLGAFGLAYRNRRKQKA
jgi:hypothetical protein